MQRCTGRGASGQYVLHPPWAPSFHHHSDTGETGTCTQHNVLRLQRVLKPGDVLVTLGLTRGLRVLMLEALRPQSRDTGTHTPASPTLDRAYDSERVLHDHPFLVSWDDERPDTRSVGADHAFSAHRGDVLLIVYL